MPSYRVQRSTTIAAPTDQVFQTVTDYRTWPNWSPWLCMEPNAQLTFSDDASSVGAVYSWQGELVGEGEIEHKQLEAPRSIDDEIRFAKPFRSTARVSFDLEDAQEGTRITWHMGGKLPWFLFWMRPQLETFIGMDYERGLKMLKEYVETGEIQSRTKIAGVQPVGPLRMIGIRNTCAIDDVGTSVQESFERAAQRMPEAGLPTDGECITVYHTFDVKARQFDYTTGFVVPPDAEPVPQGLSQWSLPAVNALAVEHVGRYDHLGNAWSAAHQYARCKKLKQSKAGSFEIYKNDPAETAPADQRTMIYLPLK